MALSACGGNSNDETASGDLSKDEQIAPEEVTAQPDGILPLEKGEVVELIEVDDLADWKPSNFGTNGEITVEDGVLNLGQGFDLTGVTWAGGELPKMNYEIALEAKRVMGGDFFCGLTFPVADSHASLIVGGWAGAVVGISSLDGLDAANNETTKVKVFENNRWYKVRVRITPNLIEAWIDDEQLVNVDTTGREVGIRAEVQPSIPLGLATWQTTGAIRNMTIQQVDGPAESSSD